MSNITTIMAWPKALISHIPRFVGAGLLGAMVVIATAGNVRATDETIWKALKDGAIVLFRHANAPGGGDPPGMRIGDCATQRNLDQTGRAQARRIGAVFRAKGIPAGRVLTSQWCRATDTAELAFPGRSEDAPPFNSFFDDRRKGPAQTAAARRLLLSWAGPGALVVTTHQVNISALTGLTTGSGEGVVLRVQDGELAVVGRVRP
jgi:phosphohistidine phosphatase SixA